MPTFEYTARNAQGQETTGTMDAASRDEVVANLRKSRMVLVRLREAKRAKRGGSVPTRDIVIFTRQFATMINSGLPLVQSLDILAEQTENPALRKTIQETLYDVESGHTLADAMAKHPKVFTELFTNMVAAGEAGGILDTILLRLATFRSGVEPHPLAGTIRLATGARATARLLSSAASIGVEPGPEGHPVFETGVATSRHLASQRSSRSRGARTAT